VITGSWLDKSYGDDDVFVAKVATGDGNVALVRQIGSADDDSLSMRGGLVVDNDGNCVVVGSTFGSLYRVRSSKELEDEPWISDVFVTILEGNSGEMVLPVFVVATVGAPGQTSGESSPVQRPEWRGRSIIFVGVMLAITIAFFANSKRGINRDVQTVRSNVTPYLNEFDVDDIDLKHSATGGWHCSYSNALARGINQRVPRSYVSFVEPLTTHDPLMTEPLKDSVLVRDSLFMDDSLTRGSALASGREDRAEVSGSVSQRLDNRRGYDSLIQAYNESWEERRRQIGNGWGKDIV
jgi:hypothetical protein